MNWIKYWNEESITSDRIIKKHNTLFYEKSFDFIQYHSDDIILDIESGKGFFGQLLVEKIKEVHLCDTSIKCINLCKKKLKIIKIYFFIFYQVMTI